MEETPICASVEKDLHITVDELVTGTAVTAPQPRTATTAPATPAPTGADEDR